MCTNDDLNFSEKAWETFYDVVDDASFLTEDARLIYDQLKNKLRITPFGEHLKRYVYKKANLSGSYSDVPLKEYQGIIRRSFADNHTPYSFQPTTAKFGALSKNWLTQPTVKRRTVLILGFGLNMSEEEVNMFLTKVLREKKLNPKDPFEVICSYCYKNRLNYLYFDKYFRRFNDLLLSSTVALTPKNNEKTENVRDRMNRVRSEEELMEYLMDFRAFGLKGSIFSVTAREHFDALYDKARSLIAENYTISSKEAQNEKARIRQRELERDVRKFDYEKQAEVRKIRNDYRVYKMEDISAADIETAICSSVPTDENYNLKAAKLSALNRQFAGKRFSRQHIRQIFSGEIEIDRFDLITLNFFIFTYDLDESLGAQQRYWKFLESTDEILMACSMGKMDVENPYECFLLMCMFSNYPLATYADVIEMSYA